MLLSSAMQYMVKGADGKEYGPTDVATLKTWATEGRLAPHSTLRDFTTGQTMVASAVPGLFESSPSLGAPPIPAAYPRGSYQSAARQGDHGGGVLVGVILRSLAGIASFYLIGGLGFIFAGYAMVYAVQCQKSGSKYGIAALIIAGISLAAVGIGWAMRLSGAHI